MRYTQYEPCAPPFFPLPGCCDPMTPGAPGAMMPGLMTFPEPSGAVATVTVTAYHADQPGGGIHA
jgi:hypothetical protein